MPPPTARNTLFVYGTLKSGRAAHHMLAGSRYVGRAKTRPVYRLRDMGPYPAMVRDEADGMAVRGELWDVDDETLELLDEYEGIEEGLYERVEIALADGGSAQGYLFRGEVPGGTASGEEWPFAE